MAHPVDVYVGHRLRQQRWLTGLTQQQLGERVGINFQQIQKYETGENRVSASRIWDIGTALKVPIAFFFEGLNGQAAEKCEEVSDILSDKEAFELVRAYNAIPKVQRKRLLELARVLSIAA